MTMRARSIEVFAILVGASAAAGAQSPPPTFTRDVAPILYSKCVECHRPGAIGPMSLLTFDDARPWAKSIRQKVADRSMPPWFADPAHGKFANDTSLTDAQIATIVDWAERGAPRGDPADVPEAPAFDDIGW
jgi:hypothetical protein